MKFLNQIIKPAYAINNPVLRNSEDQVANPTNYINNVIQTIISIFFIVAVLYFTWYFVMSAYHMISSNGDAKKLEESRNSIVNAFLGIVIVFALFAILKFVGTILGIEGLGTLKLSWPSL
jgi:hypothetical protein